MFIYELSSALTPELPLTFHQTSASPWPTYLEYPKKTTDLPQVTDKLCHMM